MKREVEKYIQEWENRCYKDIPNEAPKRLEEMGRVPSYRVICKAILQCNLKIIGVTGKRSKYYDQLKRKELKDRGEIIQMEIFDA